MAIGPGGKAMDCKSSDCSQQTVFDSRDRLKLGLIQQQFIKIDDNQVDEQ